jgi:hypothetical protein
VQIRCACRFFLKNRAGYTDRKDGETDGSAALETGLLNVQEGFEKGYKSGFQKANRLKAGCARLAGSGGLMG